MSNSEVIVDLVLNKNAHVYVCGRQVLAGEVDEKLKSIFGDSCCLTPEVSPEKFLQDMRVWFLFLKVVNLILDISVILF